MIYSIQDATIDQNWVGAQIASTTLLLRQPIQMVYQEVYIKADTVVLNDNHRAHGAELGMRMGGLPEQISKSPWTSGSTDLGPARTGKSTIAPTIACTIAERVFADRLGTLLFCLIGGHGVEDHSDFQYIFPTRTMFLPHVIQHVQLLTIPTSHLMSLNTEPTRL